MLILWRVAAALLLTLGVALSTIGGGTFARGFGGAVAPVCAPSPPSQATTAPANYSTLVLCEPFVTNQRVDAKNTLQPGYVLYTQDPFPPGTFDPLGAGSVWNDGTGLAFGNISSVPARAPTSAGYSASSPYWVGTAFTGGYYMEVTMKYPSVNPTGNPGTGTWPAFWTVALAAHLTGTAACPGMAQYTELDMMEYYAPNLNESTNPWLGLNEWKCVGSTETRINNTTVTFGSQSVASYLTYGFLWVTAASNSGTGILKSYVNNSLVASCDYYQSSAPSCGGPSGAYYSLESQGPNELIFDMYNGIVGPDVIKDLHVWCASSSCVTHQP